MSTDHDVTRIVRSWLEEGTTVVPDRVLDGVLEQIPTTHQRRAWWPARRFPIMNNMVLRVGLAAAAVILIALLGMRLLPGTQVGGPGPTATPTFAPTPIPALKSQESLKGRYSVNSGLPEEVSVSVPSGWSAGDDWVVRARRAMALRPAWPSGSTRCRTCSGIPARLLMGCCSHRLAQLRMIWCRRLAGSRHGMHPHPVISSSTGARQSTSS